MPEVLTVLSFVLEKLVARNNRLLDILSGCESSGQPTRCQVGKSLNGFHGVRAPRISISKYLERIYKYTNISLSCFVVGFVYIDRLVHRHLDSLIMSLNVNRLLVTSIMVASKMLDDFHYNNTFYARLGWVSNAELNRLEIELLFLVFEIYCLHLEREMLVNGYGQWIEKVLLLSEDAAQNVIKRTQSMPLRRALG